jgi:glyoxylase-like metal-dependent hydrolase (beta-lactamase superfamily II)
MTEYATLIRADNPGPMTLDGTNTWLLRAPGSDAVVVVDPGQGGDGHLDLLLEQAPGLSTVLLTHGHVDHSQTAAQLHERTGVGVRAADPAHCHGAEPLTDNLVLDAAGLRISVLGTPGHTSDSVSFVVSSADGEALAVLTGDTILGRGTTVVAYPDGNLREYLDSLHRLRSLDGLIVLPGHGPELPHIGQAAQFYLDHRAQRLEQVRAAVQQLGPHVAARQIVELVYADVDRAVWPAAELSVEAQLEYLRG